MAAPKSKKTKVVKSKSKKAEPYRHAEATSLMRPEVGTQAQFKKKETTENLPVRFVIVAGA